MERGRGGASGDVSLLGRGRGYRRIVLAAAYLKVQFFFQNTAAEGKNDIGKRLSVDCHLTANRTPKDY